jgi:membrane-associated protease RseP (regulator of RpoE activity)
VERSEPSDAWDDAGDDPRDDALYGPAPLPAHERTWRHPSEMGQTAWVLTEPPVAIGRGLLVTTGAIGCVLGIAVLWLLVPIGGGLAPTASPTVTSSFNGVRGTITSTSVVPDRTDLVSDTVVLQPSQITLPSEDVPLNTVLVTRPKTPDTNAVAVAVSSGDAPFIVTTANAVSDTEGFSMVGAGDPSNGSIVAIDGKLAYLASTDDLEVVGFSATGSAHDGDMVTVLGQEQTPVHFGTGAMAELDATVVREGTPVIDESGALVALCTLVQGTDGSYAVALVPIGQPPVPDPSTSVPTTSTVIDTSTTTTAPAPSTTPTTVAPLLAWAGIRGFGEVDPASLPIITSVSPDSPAAVAGLVAGDQIVAVDGVRVTRVDEVLAAIKAKAPGDTIVFTVITTTPTAPATTDSSTTTSTTSTTTTVSSSTATTTSTTLPPAPVERSISVVLGVYEPTV